MLFYADLQYFTLKDQDPKRFVMLMPRNHGKYTAIKNWLKWAKHRTGPRMYVEDGRLIRRFPRDG